MVPEPSGRAGTSSRLAHPAAALGRCARAHGDRRAGARDATDLRFVDTEHAPMSNEFTIEDAGVPTGFAADVAQVVAAIRLRETTALIGFARIEPPDPGAGEEEAERRR